MKYYLDTEFDGLDGPLLSMGIIREDGRSLYVIMHELPLNVWVQCNVVPHLRSVPMDLVTFFFEGVTIVQLPGLLEQYFEGDDEPHVIADWPDDFKYLCEALITGPGTMINIPTIRMEVARIDAYPTTLAGAVQHNAWWDAVVLMDCLRR